MWEFNLLGTDLYHIIHWFFIYSFLGWCIETCYIAITEKRIVNTGFINGPFCTVYGFGALSVYFILKPIDYNILTLFISGIIVPSIIEYFTGWLMEVIFKATWWDYSNNKFNIKGRVCLLNSVLWGFLTVALFLFIHPFVEFIVSLYSMSTGITIGTIIIIIYIIDYAITCYYAIDLKNTLMKMSDLMNEFVSYIQSIKLYGTREEVMDYLEKSKPVEFINKSKEKLKTSINLNKSNSKEKILDKINMLNIRYDSLKTKCNVIHLRLFKAFPKLKIKGKEKYIEDLKSHLFKKKQ